MTLKEKECLELQERIGYDFVNKDLLIQALSHSSFVNERKLNKSESYERLEFLGDAVLELVSSTELFKRHENLKEGQMSKLRASLVCEKALAPCARKIQLGSCILLGRGEIMNKGYEHDSILSDVLEALIGAIYMDGGFEKATEFIMHFVLNEEALSSGVTDYKTILQELVFSDSKKEIIYKQVGTSGPDHDKIYFVDLYIGDELMGHGEASNKKAAEAAAAREAYEKLI